MSRRLLILACSATKHRTPGHMPAIERYNGPLWMTLRTVDPGGARAFVSVLSARFGWQPGSTPIDDYEQLMTPERVRELKTGGIKAGWPAGNWKTPAGLNPSHWLYSQSYVGRFTEVCICGGYKYVDVASAYVTQAKGREFIEPDAPVTIINDQIGLMRQQLKAWLLAGPIGPARNEQASTYILKQMRRPS